MNNRYTLAAIIATSIVIASYVCYFYFILKYNISNDTAVWGQFSDYVGGLLNPILSFIALILLIKSLSLQNEANQSLRSELKNNEKSEKFRTFETHFFNMIKSQSEYFELFKIETTEEGNTTTLTGSQSLIYIENEIESMRKRGCENNDILKFIEEIDVNDHIFEITRRFYIMVKMISEKLSDTEGFDANERKSHFLTLINFTDFSLLRLIMISMQFMEYQSTNYLKSEKEFNSALQQVGINWNLY